MCCRRIGKRKRCKRLVNHDAGIVYCDTSKYSAFVLDAGANCPGAKSFSIADQIAAPPTASRGMYPAPATCPSLLVIIIERVHRTQFQHPILPRFSQS